MDFNVCCHNWYLIACYCNGQYFIIVQEIHSQYTMERSSQRKIKIMTIVVVTAHNYTRELGGTEGVIIATLTVYI